MHACYVDDTIVESTFPVVIEVPKGSKNRYELNKETGLLRLDRRIIREPLDLYRQLRRGELRRA
jgi:inorganic pyrophosphatase